jgi:hypothetical protein
MVTALDLVESWVEAAVMVTCVATVINEDAVNVTGVPEATFDEALKVPAVVGLTERFTVFV